LKAVSVNDDEDIHILDHALTFKAREKICGPEY
jgi:hypothetical protein